MNVNRYEFVTRWRVRGTCEEVSDILGQPLELARWWPSVYLEVKELKPGDPKTGLGKVVDLYTKGWLPYTLRWAFEVTRSDYPHGFTIVPHGDFEGSGVWTITPDGDFVDVVYEWRIEATKPLLRALAPLLKPALQANHRWAMERGQESLKLELLRRRAGTPEQRTAVPQPPSATFVRRRSKADYPLKAEGPPGGR